MIKRLALAVAASAALSFLPVGARAADTGSVHYTVGTIGVTTGSGYFIFWLEGHVSAGCEQTDRFAIRMSDPNAKEIMEVIKMAFLSGHPVRVEWNECTGGGTAGAPRPTYVKIYRN